MVANIQRNATIEELKSRLDIVEIIGECIELKPNGKEYKGLCPFHQEKSPSFSVNPEKKTYHCFGCGVGGDAINFLQELGKRSFQDVIAELGQRYGVAVQVSDRDRSQRRQPIKARNIPKPKAPKMPPPPEGEVRLARLAAPAEDIPQPQQDYDQKHGKVLKTTFVYSLTEDGELNRWVVRSEWKQCDPEKAKTKAHEKIHIPFRRAVGGEQVPLPKKKGQPQEYRTAIAGETLCGKGDALWEAYRINEAIASINSVTEGVPALLVQEGEPCVELARRIGLASFTFQGGSWTVEAMLPEVLRFKEAQAILVMLRDHDEAGEKKAKLFQECYALAGVYGIIIDPCSLLLPDEGELPKGADIKELLQLMSGDELIRRLEEQIRQAIADQREENNTRDEFVVEDIPESFNPKEEFLQQALDVLYGDKPWICVNDSLYFWADNHYKPSLDVIELRRIRNYCNAYAVAGKDEISYPFASPASVKKALEWVKISTGIDPKSVNPPGLNCTNGVLQIVWDGAKPSWELIPHSPELYYIYEPKVTYKPDADLSHCDRLLAALSEPEQKIFLRTVAASLDLPKVRRFKGRMVRALLCKGDGSNGKDALRTLVYQMYGGVGLTSKSLSDFAAYDTGRKFPLAGLLNSRVNWSSENTNTSQLDRIQSLKAFITGDTLSFEAKGKDEFEFEPTAISLFNINDLPNLNGSLEAIQSRYAILNFLKTFKIGADPSKGEIEADPRFKYDPEFVSEQVLPAFLNRVLQALMDLMREGIDYEPTRQTLEGIQAQNSHLFQFCQDVGLGYVPDSTVTVGEVWDKLRQWYLESGTLSIEGTNSGKEKFIWIDQVNKRDANVKGSNQVLARFLQLFPKAKRAALANHKVGITGIGFTDPRSQLGVNQESVGSQLGSQQPLQDKGWESMKPVSSDVVEIEEKAVEEIIAVDARCEKTDEVAELPTLTPDVDTARVTGSLAAPLTDSQLTPNTPQTTEAPTPDQIPAASAEFTQEEIGDAVSVLEIVAENPDEHECLQEARKQFPPALLNVAAKRLGAEKHGQIMQLIKKAPDVEKKKIAVLTFELAEALDWGTREKINEALAQIPARLAETIRDELTTVRQQKLAKFFEAQAEVKPQPEAQPEAIEKARYLPDNRQIILDIELDAIQCLFDEL